jgi:hypothetical protein
MPQKTRGCGPVRGEIRVGERSRAGYHGSVSRIHMTNIPLVSM